MLVGPVALDHLYLNQNLSFIALIRCARNKNKQTNTQALLSALYKPHRRFCLRVYYDARVVLRLCFAKRHLSVE
jgi:hypothetical protein